MSLVTYLINLDGSDERLRYASEQLIESNIAFIRVPAFDGRGLDPHTISEYDEQRAIAYMGRALRGGEIGCYLSHLDCARRFLTSDAQYGIVFEDDMQLSDNAFEVIGQLLRWLELNEQKWHLLHLGANKRKIYTALAQLSGRELMRAHYFPMTTTGLIWSREGAQAFLDSHQTIFAPIDNYFRLWLTKSNMGLSVWPPLVATTGAQSEIDGQTIKRKTSGRSWSYGLAKQKRLWFDKIIALYHKYL